MLNATNKKVSNGRDCTSKDLKTDDLVDINSHLSWTTPSNRKGRLNHTKT